MSTNNIKAVKHDEALSEMEASLVAQDSEVEAEPVEQIAEEAAQEESAPTEEQTTEEEEAKPVEEATILLTVASCSILASLFSIFITGYVSDEDASSSIKASHSTLLLALAAAGITETSPR
jgi:hypothetical protein